MNRTSDPKKGRISRLCVPVFVLLIILLVSLGTPVRAAENGNTANMASDIPHVSISAPVIVPTGSQLTVQVAITNVVNLNSAQFDLSFDPAVIQVTGVEGGSGVTNGLIGGTSFPLFGWSWQSETEKPSGCVRVTCHKPGIGVVNGDGYLVEIHFNVLGAYGTGSALKLSGVELWNQLADSLPLSQSDGGILVYTSKASSSTVLLSSACPSGFGQTVSFNATVSPVPPVIKISSGTVSFKDGEQELGAVALDNAGQAILVITNLAIGTHNLTAIYSGDVNFAASTSPVLTQTVEAIPNDVPLSLEPANVPSISSGQTFDMEIKTNGTTQQVSRVQAFISFDPSKLEVIDADPAEEGVQITSGTILNTKISNTVDNAGGLISYAASKSVSPFPSGPFNIATIRFRAKSVSIEVTTMVTISISGPSTTSVVEISGERVYGSHRNSSVQITPGSMVTFALELQGGSRAEAGWMVPITVKIFTPGAITLVDVLAATPVSTFNLTTAKAGTAAMAQTMVVPGIYDTSVVSPHCLTNVKRGIVIAAPSTLVNLGTLLEGDANNNGKVNIQDFGVLAAAYGKTSGDAGYNSSADFNCDGKVNITDFGLLASNYGLNAPINVTTP
jgi:hypothetical protein